MSKLKSFAIILMFLVGMSMVSAVDMTSGLVGYYSYDPFGGGISDDSSYSHDLTLVGPTEDTGVISSGLDFTPNDYATAADNAEYDQTGSIGICSWLKIDTAADGKYIFHDDGFGVRMETDGSHGGCSAGNKFAFVIVGKATVCNNAQTFTEDTWEHWCFFKNSTAVTYYKNGVRGDNDAETNTMNVGATAFNMGRDTGVSVYADMFIDETAIYSAIHSEYVSYLYNGGSGCNPVSNPSGCSASATPYINMTTRLVAGVNVSNYPYTFNISGNKLVAAPNSFNCSLYLNGTLTTTKLNVALNNTFQYFNLTYGPQQKAYNVNVTCENANITTSIQRNNVFIDSVTPYITLLSPAANNSLYYRGYTAAVTPSVFCNDPNLYSCNLTLARLSAGGVINETLNNSIYTNILTPNKTVTITRQISTMGDGKYAIIAISKDSHTAQNIKNYKQDKIAGGYKIEDKVKITSPDLVSIDLVKNRDRYNFDMSFTKKNPTIDVECEGGVTYIANSPYQGHLVCFSENKWIDFEDASSSPVLVETISKTKVKVTPLSSGKSFKFHSIGDLNTNKVIYYFNVSESNFAFSMSIFDEDHPSHALTGSAEVEFTYFDGINPNATHYNASFSGSDTYAFAIASNVSLVRGDLYIKYTTANGFTHRYIVSNTSFNTTDGYNLVLYNYNTTTAISGLKITARQNANFNYYSGIIAKLQRRYTAEGVWRTVQMDQSGDFGLLYFNVREKSTDYRIIFTDLNNHVLHTTDTLKFVCTDALCDLTTLLSPYEASSVSADLTASGSYNNNTNMVNFTWNDAQGGSNTVRIRARQDTVTGAVYPCDVTQNGAGGSYQCNLTGRQGIIEISVIGNGDILFTDFVEIKVGKLGADIDEKEGAFWSVMIIILCVMFGIFSPIAAIIMMLFGLVVIYMLGIFAPLTITFMIIATAISVVIGFKVRS